MRTTLLFSGLILALACGDDDGVLGDSGTRDSGTSDTGTSDSGDDGDGGDDDAGADDAGADDAGAEDAGADDAAGDTGDPCATVTIGDPCEGDEDCGAHVCDVGTSRCMPLDRPSCGGFAGAVCPDDGFSRCLNRSEIADDIGPCLTPTEITCVCAEHSDTYACPED